MSTHPEYEDLMTEALFGEIGPKDRRRLDRHLDTCDDCREEFERLQATLDVVSERERDELPPTYWTSFRKQVLDRTERAPSLGERIAQWWDSLPILLPQTSGQWATQGLAAVFFVAVGLWLSPDPFRSSTATRTPSAPTSSNAVPLTGDLLDPASASPEIERVRPRLRGIQDIAYHRDDGQVEIRYSTENEVTVRGSPDDPDIRRLLAAALLDHGRPAGQLNAVQTLERADLRPTDDLVRAVTVLIRTEDRTSLQVRAVRALRQMHGDRPLDEPTRNLLVGLVLDDHPDALRVEALQTLLAAPDSTADPSYLYALRDAPNDYLRYQAQSTLQAAAQVGPPRSTPQ